MRSITKTGSMLALVFSVALSGCATVDYDAMGKALRQIPAEPPETCTVEIDGRVMSASGERSCDRLISLAERDEARADAAEICGEMGQPKGQVSNEENNNYSIWYTMCVDQVMDGNSNIALADARGSQEQVDDSKSTRELSVMFMMQEAQNASAERRAWITSLVPAIAGLGMRTFDHLDNKSNNQVWQELAKAAGAPNNVNISKSDDGGGGGEGAGGRGGDGDQVVVIGNDNQSLLRSDGSVLSYGRNGAFQGLNDPQDSFRSENENNNDAPNATNNNDPAVSQTDADGSNNSSILGLPGA